MVKYLKTDGVNGVITVPAFAFTDVELDIVIEKKTTWGKYFSTNYTWFQQNSNTNNDQWDTNSINVVLRDGVAQTNLTPFASLNERHTYTIKFLTTRNHVSYVFSNMSSTTAMTGGKIYGIKYFNGATLVAHYDMSTGTVEDQSGNGNHATLNGGTWLDDGTGGETGTEVSSSYSVKQALFANQETTALAKQSIYRNQADFQALKQLITKISSVDATTRQSIYKTESTLFDMLIDLYNASVTKIDNFALRVQIYKQDYADYLLTQQLFKQLAEIKAAIHNHLFVQNITKATTQQTFSKMNSVELSLKQVIYSSDITSYDTLQQLLSDWNEYREVIEFILNITTSTQQDLNITTRLPRELNITQKKQYDLNI